MRGGARKRFPPGQTDSSPSSFGYFRIASNDVLCCCGKTISFLKPAGCFSSREPVEQSSSSRRIHFGLIDRACWTWGVYTILQSADRSTLILLFADDSMTRNHIACATLTLSDSGVINTRSRVRSFRLAWRVQFRQHRARRLLTQSIPMGAHGLLRARYIVTRLLLPPCVEDSPPYEPPVVDMTDGAWRSSLYFLLQRPDQKRRRMRVDLNLT